ncbi:MAG: hypothetical protein JNJ88_19330 [Planctomycetes bacterium]|nr:hypothetical protein [Planctomycetota bacterium]
MKAFGYMILAASAFSAVAVAQDAQNAPVGFSGTGQRQAAPAPTLPQSAVVARYRMPYGDLKRFDPPALGRESVKSAAVPRLAASSAAAPERLTLFESVLANRILELPRVRAVVFGRESTVRRGVLTAPSDAAPIASETSDQPFLEVRADDREFEPQVQRILNEYQSLASQRFDLETIFVTSSAPSLAIDGAAVSYVSDSEFEQVRAADSKEPRDLLSAPRLTLSQGSVGNIAALNQRAFVTGYDKQSIGSSTILDPVVEVLQTGLVLEASVVQIPGANGGVCQVALTLADVLDPVPTAELKVAPSLAPVTIQLPEENRTTWKSEPLHFNDARHAFRVTGIRYLGRKAAAAPMGSDATEAHEYKSLEFYFRVMPASAQSGAGEWGRVLLLDGDRRRVVVRRSESSAGAASDRATTVTETGRPPSVLELETDSGAILIYRVVEGPMPRVDDPVR